MYQGDLITAPNQTGFSHVTSNQAVQNSMLSVVEITQKN